MGEGDWCSAGRALATVTLPAAMTQRPGDSAPCATMTRPAGKRRTAMSAAHLSTTCRGAPAKSGQSRRSRALRTVRCLRAGSRRVRVRRNRVRQNDGLDRSTRSPGRLELVRMVQMPGDALPETVRTGMSIVELQVSKSMVALQVITRMILAGARTRCGGPRPKRQGPGYLPQEHNAQTRRARSRPSRSSRGVPDNPSRLSVSAGRAPGVEPEAAEVVGLGQEQGRDGVVCRGGGRADIV